MKKIARILITLFIALLSMTVCDDSGGGRSDSPSMGTFVKEITFGGATSINNGLFAANDFRHYQLLYRASDIAGSGNINSIFFKYAAGVSRTSCPHVTIRLAHTSRENLATGNMDLNIAGRGSAVTVLDDATITVPAGNAGDYFKIALSTPFAYNGVDNLIVDIIRTVACSQTLQIVREAGSPPYTSIVWSESSAAPYTAESTDYTTNVLHTRFGFAGGDNTAVKPGTTDSTFPFTNYDAYNKVQQLYLASDINGSGPITGIAYSLDADLAESCAFIISVRMGHTDLSELTTVFADNFNAGPPVTVADGVNFRVPAGATEGSFVWIPFPGGPFYYNGSDNLIVETRVTYASAALALQETTRSRSRLTGPVAAAAGSRDEYLPGIKFRFRGGAMDVIDGYDQDVTVFSSSAGGYQFLVRASELGSAGSIIRLAFRLSGSCSAGDYPDFTVTLAHTSQNVLLGDDETNVSGGAMVYNKTFTMPAGLKDGDWIEIPFSAPFTYNGADNLVIQTTSGPGTAVNYVQATADPARYADCTKATGSAPGDYRGVFRFWVK